MIYAVVGFIGSGKGTVGDYLVNERGFIQESFARTLKDVVAVLFGYPRDMLEGNTPESREWREQVDEKWARLLGIPDFTPRWALQHIGTDIFRKHFNEDMWLLTMQARLEDYGDKDVIITDCRFRNEIAFVQKMGGKIIRVDDAQPREWFYIAHRAAQGNGHSIRQMETYYKIHRSEWDWVNVKEDVIIRNDFNERSEKTMKAFHARINDAVNSIKMSAQ